MSAGPNALHIAYTHTAAEKQHRSVSVDTRREKGVESRMVPRGAVPWRAAANCSLTRPISAMPDAVPPAVAAAECVDKSVAPRGTIRHSTQSEDWRTARTSKISCAQTTHLSLAKLHREAGLSLLKPSPPSAGAICGLEPPAGPQPHFALTAAAERRRLLATPHHHSTHALSTPPS